MDLTDFAALSDAVSLILAGFGLGTVVGVFAGLLRMWRR